MTLTTPLVAAIGSHALEDTYVAQDAPHLSLDNLVVSFKDAQDGDVVALSYPFDSNYVVTHDQDSTPNDFLVLVKKGEGVALATLDTVENAKDITAWAKYAADVNKWNVALGADAVQLLDKTIFDNGYKADAFFFSDFVVAKARTNETLAIVFPGKEKRSLDTDNIPESLQTFLGSIINALS